MYFMPIRLPYWVCLLISNTTDALIAILHPNLARNGNLSLLMQTSLLMCLKPKTAVQIVCDMLLLYLSLCLTDFELALLAAFLESIGLVRESIRNIFLKSTAVCPQTQHKKWGVSLAGHNSLAFLN